MGRLVENQALREFHDFANATQTLIWQGVVAVMAARRSVAESRRLCEHARELLADLSEPPARHLT